MLRSSLIILVLVCSFTVQLSYAEPVMVGVHIAPPVMNVDSNGKYYGSMITTLEKILKEADVEYKFIEYPTRRLYKKLGEGEVHIFVGIKNVPEYHDSVIYSDDVVDRLSISILRDKNTSPVSKKEDLAGKSVIINLGYSYAGLREFVRDKNNNVTAIFGKSNKKMLQLLASDRADYCVFYERIAKQALSEYPLIDIEMDIIRKIDFYVILSKNAPHKNKLIAAMNKIAKEDSKSLGIGRY